VLSWIGVRGVTIRCLGLRIFLRGVLQCRFRVSRWACEALVVGSVEVHEFTANSRKVSRYWAGLHRL